MSAGICIMNRQAIALAADSAVTVNNHMAIFNSANKLFALSRFSPVGLIMYANTSLMSVPLEIIVKQYRRNLGNKTFDNLKDYVFDFLTYVENNSKLFRFDINEESYVLSVFENFIKGLLCDYKKIKEENKSDKETEDEVVQCSLNFVEELKKNDNNNFASYVKSKFFQKFIDTIKNNEDCNWMTEESVNKVCDKACALFDTKFERNGYVGIAIAGYGENEIYPKMYHLHVSGVINNKLRYFIEDEVEITENNPASIIPLAQIDVMQTFLFGINDRFIKDLTSEIPKQIDNAIDAMDDNYFANKDKEIIKKQMHDIMTEKIINRMTTNAEQNYLIPIIFSVAALPIEELSLLAESMINITSLRRKVALDRNIGTVGGPIDVAIISKGDGFIWLKRKHYFEGKYNPQYFFSRFNNSSEKGCQDD